MSVRTIRTAISNRLKRRDSQRGMSGVTIAVMLAAFAVVTLTIVQAATASTASVTQAGIPGLIG